MSKKKTYSIWFQLNRAIQIEWEMDGKRGEKEKWRMFSVIQQTVHEYECNLMRCAAIWSLCFSFSFSHFVYFGCFQENATSYPMIIIKLIRHAWFEFSQNWNGNHRIALSKCHRLLFVVANEKPLLLIERAINRWEKSTDCK